MGFFTKNSENNILEFKDFDIFWEERYQNLLHASDFLSCLPQNSGYGPAGISNVNSVINSERWKIFKLGVIMLRLKCSLVTRNNHSRDGFISNKQKRLLTISLVSITNTQFLGIIFFFKMCRLTLKLDLFH